MSTEKTKLKFLNSFLELMAVRPVNKITVKDISANCGLTPQTFYNHFADKYDLILWAYRVRVDELNERYEKGELEWRQLLKEYLRGFKENDKEILNIMKNTHGSDSYYVGTSAHLLKCMKESLKKRLRVEELDAKTDMLLNTYIGGLINVIALWLDQRDDLDEKDMAEILDLAMPEYLREIYLIR